MAKSRATVGARKRRRVKKDHDRFIGLTQGVSLSVGIGMGVYGQAELLGEPLASRARD